MVKATTDGAEAAGKAAAAMGEAGGAVGEGAEPAGELVGAVAEELEPGAIGVMLGGAVWLLGGVTGAVGEVGMVLGERVGSRVPGGVVTGKAGDSPVLGDNADEARRVFGEVGVVGEELGLELWGLGGAPEAVKAAVDEIAPGLLGETIAGVGIGVWEAPGEAAKAADAPVRSEVAAEAVGGATGEFEGVVEKVAGLVEKDEVAFEGLRGTAEGATEVGEGLMVFAAPAVDEVEEVCEELPGTAGVPEPAGEGLEGVGKVFAGVTEPGEGVWEVVGGVVEVDEEAGEVLEEVAEVAEGLAEVEGFGEVVTRVGAGVEEVVEG